MAARLDLECRQELQVGMPPSTLRVDAALMGADGNRQSETGPVAAHPARQALRVLASREPAGLRRCLVEIIDGEMPVDPTSKEIRPEELRERLAALCAPTLADQGSGKTAEGIIRKVGKIRRYGVERASPPFCIVGVAPAAIVEERPELVLWQVGQIIDHVDHDVAGFLLEQGARKVMVVDKIRLF